MSAGAITGLRSECPFTLETEDVPHLSESLSLESMCFDLSRVRRDLFRVPDKFIATG
jgi:hypothetical protein